MELFRILTCICLLGSALPSVLLVSVRSSSEFISVLETSPGIGREGRRGRGLLVLVFFTDYRERSCLDLRSVCPFGK